MSGSADEIIRDPREGRAVHRFLVKPADAGFLGAVDGGTLLEWIDKVGFACAARWSGQYCVTAYVGNIHLTRTIAVGELVELDARIIYTGRSSMHILVTVYSTDPTQAKPQLASQCLIVFVAVDDAGGTVTVPAWVPLTDDDVDRAEQARRRVALRTEIEKAMSGTRYTEAGTAPTATLRFLAAPTDINWGGNVHGGRTMRWIDEGGYVCAADWAGQQVLSSYIAGIRFYRPIHIGQIVETRARLIHTGPRSMHLSIHVTAADPHDPDPYLAAHGLSVFVAPDVNGAPRPVPPWSPRSDEDHMLNDHALHLIHLRSKISPFTAVDRAPDASFPPLHT
jgi:acyl-CoA hydrolase